MSCSDQDHGRELRVGSFVPTEEAVKLELAAAWRRLGPCYVAPKYDGYRIQIHKDGERARLFTRGGHDWTDRFPTLGAGLGALSALPSAILDSEVVAVDQQSGRLLTLDAVSRPGVALRAIVFDLLLLEGQDWTGRPLHARLVTIGRLLAELRSPLLLPPGDQYVDSFAALEGLYRHTLAAGLEGIVMKAADTPYLAGARNKGRIKVKPADTLDCVVLGFNRSGERLGALLMGVRSPATGRLASVALVGGGLKQAEREALAAELEALALPAPPPEVSAGVAPQVWVQPHVVVEVKASFRRPSKQHRAGLAETAAAYELVGASCARRRPDKPASAASTVDDLLQLGLAPGHEHETRQPSQLALFE